MLEYSTNHEKLHPVFTLLLFSFTNVDPGCMTMPLHQKTNDWQLTKTKIQNFLPLIYCYIPQVTTRSCWQEKIIKKKNSNRWFQNVKSARIIWDVNVAPTLLMPSSTTILLLHQNQTKCSKRNPFESGSTSMSTKSTELGWQQSGFWTRPEILNPQIKWKLTAK